MTLRQWLLEEPFTLALSSGFFGFFAHAGFVSVLDEEDILPEKVTGCSAGALTGSLWAGGMSVDELMGFFQSVEKSDFWDPALGLGLLKGQKFRDLLTKHAPVKNLEECKLPISVSVHHIRKWNTKVFERGPLPEIVYASCSIPPLFQPVKIDGCLYSDGAISDSAGLVGVADKSRVLFHQLKPRSKAKQRKDILSAHRDRLDIARVMIDRVPFVDPNHLSLGAEAFDAVRENFGKQLDEPVSAVLL